ncbi:uncharacterized protein At5g43822-like [Salvia hispanica]|uniref:uncharacterized protein At5g43822-like n=1 Tax=Salvia hispanica TaxID=49212 RepID=UPI002009B6BD|nr:uncharacterized protein At5g43822-like [Salvia hispanica]
MESIVKNIRDNSGKLRMKLADGKSFSLDLFRNFLMHLPSSRGFRKEFGGIVSSLEKVVRDSKQLAKVGSAQMTAKQLQQQIGVKPTLADCIEGLRLLEEMHRSEYLLKLSLVSALPALALKPSASADLGALQQLLVDQPNIPRRRRLSFVLELELELWFRFETVDYGYGMKRRKSLQQNVPNPTFDFKSNLI